MAILVTGGTGFIGSHTVVELLNDGREVIIVDNLCNSKLCVLDRIKTITGKDVKFYKADLLDFDAIDKIFKENDIDSVIHFAGLKAVGESVAKPMLYYHNNITGNITNNADVILEDKVRNIETICKMLDTQADIVRQTLKSGMESDSKLVDDL